MARASGGRILLRIENHDRQRCRREYEAALLDDLEWLGFVPDEPPLDAFHAGPTGARQSERQHIYEDALATLRGQGLVYACECTRSDIAAAAGAAGDEPRYPGTCAAKGLAEDPGRGLRVRLRPSVERFVDGRHGLQEQRPNEQCGDLLVRDRAGNWTYQFAAVVDDLAQGVTWVIRGDDLLASTGRQIQMARLLGRSVPPRFYHHALVMRTPEQKLSKADSDTGVRDFRAGGWSADRVIGHAAFLGGLIERHEPVTADAVSSLPAMTAAAFRMRAWA
jgi:glutamyl/glutaminyl-tRNA synthetase